jgi:starch synthase (maltosyl-transferring)
LTSPRPRILLLATTLEIGGAERVIERLALGLRARYDIEAASVLGTEGGVGASLAAAGVPVHDLGAASKLELPRVLARLSGLLRERAVDLVSSFLFHANMVARLATLRPRGATRPKLVVSLRIVEPGRPWRLALERLAAGLADRVVCVAEAVRRAAGAQGDPRFLVIPNGVPIPAEPAPLAPGARWISVGRLDEQKGHDVLIEAWRRLGARAPRLAIVGRGPREADLRARAAGLPIELCGERPEIEALLRSAGGFVLASRDEGLSNALLEAMAAGLPIVATRAGGTPEAVDDRSGILVPPDDPDALAAAVAALAADPERARTLATTTRARAAALFSVERMVAAWGALYDELLAGSR